MQTGVDNRRSGGGGNRADRAEDWAASVPSCRSPRLSGAGARAGGLPVDNKPRSCSTEGGHLPFPARGSLSTPFFS
jgi:hypothetical protein